jgi:hypothetical protein
MDMGVVKVELSTDEVFASDSRETPDSCYECASYTFYNTHGAAIDKGKSDLRIPIITISIH